MPVTLAALGFEMMALAALFTLFMDTAAPMALPSASNMADATELAVLLAFLASLGAALLPVLDTLAGRVLVAGTLCLGLLIPLAIHLTVRLVDRPAASIAAIFVLVGGFTLRWAILATPQELVTRSSEGVPAQLFTDFGPESERLRGQGAGGDAGNRPREFQPRSKVFRP